MKRTFDEELEADMAAREVPKERKEKLQKKFDEADDELKKRIDIGQFVLSDEAVAELSAFQQKFDNAGDTQHWIEYIEGSWVAINDTLKRMRTIAKTDLKGR